MYKIFVVSDSTGRTAQQMLESAMMQFRHVQDVDIKVRSNILTEERVLAVLQEAVQEKGVIIHTIVEQGLRNLLIRESKLQNLETVDLMGPMLDSLSHFFAKPPSEKPGLFHEINQAYFNRIEAMEFAFHHDDGQRLDDLRKAEIILVGVSRTFKTPLSIYLALKGWFVANIPLILNIQPPQQLFEVDPQKVIALSTRPMSLSELRRARESYLKYKTGEYATLEHVKKELEYAKRIYAKNPRWKQINVTNKPIEEIASEIIKHFAKEDLQDGKA